MFIWGIDIHSDKFHILNTSGSAIFIKVKTAIKFERMKYDQSDTEATDIKKPYQSRAFLLIY